MSSRLGFTLGVVAGKLAFGAKFDFLVGEPYLCGFLFIFMITHSFQANFLK